MLSFIACALPTLQKATPRIGASKQWHSLTKLWQCVRGMRVKE